MSLHGRNVSLLSCLILLAEDYEDALAEHVRIKKAGGNGNIRVFAHSYRALCFRWNTNLIEADIVKLTLWQYEAIPC